VKIFPELRSLVTLRRIAKALERSNDLTEEMLNRQFPTRRERQASKVEFSVASSEDWNKRWAESHPEE